MEKPKCTIPIFFLSALILFASCNTNGNDEFTDSFSYQINEQSVIKADTTRRQIGTDSLVTVFEFSVEPGDSTVFIFNHNQIPPDDVIDGGFSEALVFQIPAGINQFEFRDEELSQAHTFYRRSIFLLPPAGFRVANGIIRGERLSAIHWIIRADVTVESVLGTFNLRFEEPFYVE